MLALTLASNVMLMTVLMSDSKKSTVLANSLRHTSCESVIVWTSACTYTDSYEGTRQWTLIPGPLQLRADRSDVRIKTSLNYLLGNTILGANDTGMNHPLGFT